MSENSLVTFKDGLGNAWFVHRPRPGKLVVIECERESFPESPVYAAIPVADAGTLAEAIQAARGPSAAPSSDALQVARWAADRLNALSPGADPWTADDVLTCARTGKKGGVN